MKESQDKNQNKTTWQFFGELVRFAIIALVIVIPIRVLVVEPFVVSGSSMFPTFENRDYLIIDKISYKLGNPKRDDVVIFRYPNDQTKFFIKRIIGLPNETVDIQGSLVTITNGEKKESFKLDEPYVKNISKNSMYLELKADEYFVMGDNRSASSDSRYWGAVKRNLLVGKAWLRLLPINHINILPGQYKQSDK
ncbi:signal peptidase I [Candidatus Nomurabacteria bacterium RIFCSPHIGHO2_01_FULL_38_19]|uniref:Signal peptidase I n=1 Tax=Candidatus Nomurabacteria bacterium RIFCSPHIGHO2_01_FULL_38_19 TaxID=1801732 RepID=A0A1F6UQ98_9BACT|nr:MAG: signal peptidase I [Candidatus Nomurabacteria bacterium RIFCSPHIGHO2_01_FULL_38_19]